MTHSRRCRSSWFHPTLAVVALAAAAPVLAQCANSWLPVASGADEMVRAMTSWDPDGPGPQPAVVVVGGDFSMIGGVAANGVATYDPVLGTWSAMGLPQFSFATSLAVMANGDLIACGALGPSGNLARWNGASWTPFAPGVSGVTCLLPVNGDLVVGGTFTSIGGTAAMGVARWNGSSWSPMPGINPITIIVPALNVRLLTRMANGDLVAGGLFTCSGGQNLARWNGAGWAAMVPSSSSLDVRSMLGLPNGDLVVGTFFGVQQWNGATWSPLASPGPVVDVRAFTLAPNGELIAGGYFPVGVARWDGGAWSTPAAGVAPGGAHAFAWLPNGELLVGGNFPSAGGLASPHIARLTTSCPATVATYGAGCAGTGGLNVISAQTLPWIGSKFRARAVGMPPLAFVLSVYGFTPLSIPFASVFPQGLPGCTILMNGDLIDVLLPSGGVVNTQIALPDDPALVGASFHHYVVPFEVDASLAFTAITNSNALTCTIGAF